LPAEPPPELSQRSHQWEDREAPLGVAPFPIADVPSERRTLIAEHAARLFSSRKISRGRFAEFLGTTPVAPVERVLDVIGLTQPEDAA
jgi:hypothetical protein